MPKNSSSKEIPDDEIDLLELFRRMGRTFSGWFKAIGNGFLICFFFLIKNLLPLILSLLIGIGLAYLIKWSTKPFYTSEITFRSNAVPNSEMIPYINKLKKLLKEKNYSGIAVALSLTPEKANEIKNIEAFWVIDKKTDQIPDYVDYRNKYNVYDTTNSRMSDRFVIKASLNVPTDLPTLRDGIFSYVNNYTVFKHKNIFRLKMADELLSRLNYDIKQLDSLQKVKYFEETRKLVPEKGGQMIFLQDQKTQLVYEDIYNLYQRKQTLDQEKDLYPDILALISDFYQPVKRSNGAFYYGKILIPICFGLMLIYLILYKNRKKLREFYRRY